MNEIYPGEVDMSGTGKRTLPKGTFKAKNTSPENWLRAAQKQRISAKIATNARAKQIANFRKIQAILNARMSRRGPGARGSATTGPVRAVALPLTSTNPTAAGAGSAPAPAVGGYTRKVRRNRRATRRRQQRKN